VALAEIAEKKGVLLNYEAAVAGGIPVIKTMRESMAGNSASAASSASSTAPATTS
jgi:homoserine dehydrogenase